MYKYIHVHTYICIYAHMCIFTCIHVYSIGESASRHTKRQIENLIQKITDCMKRNLRLTSKKRRGANLRAKKEGSWIELIKSLYLNIPDARVTSADLSPQATVVLCLPHARRWVATARTPAQPPQQHERLKLLVRVLITCNCCLARAHCP